MPNSPRIPNLICHPALCNNLKYAVEAGTDFFNLASLKQQLILTATQKDFKQALTTASSMDGSSPLVPMTWIAPPLVLCKPVLPPNHRSSASSSLILTKNNFCDGMSRWSSFSSAANWCQIGDLQPSSVPGTNQTAQSASTKSVVCWLYSHALKGKITAMRSSSANQHKSGVRPQLIG
eukprot:jgi/Psemu1/43481/gm1.43481_g